MYNIMSPKWWINELVSVFVTMIFIFIIKYVANKFSVPVVSTVANAI